MDTIATVERLTPKLRNVEVSIDPVDAIFIVAALAELENRLPEFPGRLPSRKDRVRRVREAIERAVYGENPGEVTESENRALWGDR